MSSSVERILEFGTSTGLLTVVIGFGVAYTIYTKLTRSRLPPGPFPLPVLGSALWVLGRPLHVTFAMLRNRYGDITSLRIASKEVVIINGFENIRQAIVSESAKFSGRPDITWTQLTRKYGLFSADGSFLHTQKSIVTSILTKLNWSKSEQAGERISVVSKDLISWLQPKLGEKVNPQIFLDTAVCNVNSLVVIGAEFKPTDDLMVALSKICMEIFLDAGAQNVNNYITLLKHIPGDPTRYKALVKNATTAMAVLQETIEKHKARLAEDPDAERRDFIDHYLDRIKAAKEPTCTEHQLLAIITDLVAMGIEATATTLRWALLLTAQNPDVQEKLQAEIDEVVKGSEPCLDHQSAMHYTSAFITELQRYVNLVSINLPHATTEDVNFQGYEIPKGTIIIPNLASVHYDSETYPEPLKFQPDRHMDSSKFKKPEKFLPYSIGGRVCFGKVLSEMEIFLFLVALLKNYRVELATEDVGEDKYGLVRYPGDFHLIFQAR